MREKTRQRRVRGTQRSVETRDHAITPSVGLHQEQFWSSWALERHMRKKNKAKKSERDTEIRRDSGRYRNAPET